MHGNRTNTIVLHFLLFPPFRSSSFFPFFFFFFFSQDPTAKAGDIVVTAEWVGDDDVALTATQEPPGSSCSDPGTNPVLGAGGTAQNTIVISCPFFPSVPEADGTIMATNTWDIQLTHTITTANSANALTITTKIDGMTVAELSGTTVIESGTRNIRFNIFELSGPVSEAVIVPPLDNFMEITVTPGGDDTAAITFTSQPTGGDCMDVAAAASAITSVCESQVPTADAEPQYSFTVNLAEGAANSGIAAAVVEVKLNGQLSDRFTIPAGGPADATLSEIFEYRIDSITGPLLRFAP